tara:strand:+ start:1135 stop:1521 length:387 start_codon:yes stop_codon:yes gene_type:complete
MAKILVVEDNEEIRSNLSSMLAESGHQVFEAEDGAVGIAQALEAKHMDLILTDLHMPGKNGIEMVAELREHDNFGKTTVIFYTTETNEVLKKQGRQLGVQYWFIKPVANAKLVSSINKALEASNRLAG